MANVPDIPTATDSAEELNWVQKPCKSLKVTTTYKRCRRETADWIQASKTRFSFQLMGEKKKKTADKKRCPCADTVFLHWLCNHISGTYQKNRLSKRSKQQHNVHLFWGVCRTTQRIEQTPIRKIKTHLSLTRNQVAQACKPTELVHISGKDILPESTTWTQLSRGGQTFWLVGQNGFFNLTEGSEQDQSPSSQNLFDKLYR